MAEGPDPREPASAAPLPVPSTPRVAIVGAGLIDRARALVFARAGCEVRVHDASGPVLDALPDRLGHDRAVLERHGLADDASATLGRITATPALDEALAAHERAEERDR